MRVLPTFDALQGLGPRPTLDEFSDLMQGRLTPAEHRLTSLEGGFGLVLPRGRGTYPVTSREPSSHVILFLKLNQTLENSDTSHPDIWELAMSHPTNIFLKGALYAPDTWAILR